MKTNRLFVIAALLGTVLASCQKEVEIKTPEEEPVVDNTGWTLTVKATKDVDTKAMSLSGKTLNAYWKEGEVVGVYFEGTRLGSLTAGVPTNSGKDVELSGTLDSVDGLVKDASQIMLIYPDKGASEPWSYMGQDGSAPSEDGTMATSYDYATATLTVTDLDAVSKKVTVGDANFVNQQSVYRLLFKNSGSAFSVKSFTLTASQGALVRSRSYTGGSWTSACGTLSMTPTVDPSDHYYFMAIRNDNTADDVYTFSVVRKDDNALLEGTKSIPTAALAGPSYIPTTITVNPKAVAAAPAATVIDDASEVL